jgi:hypothetical protein
MAAGREYKTSSRLDRLLNHFREPRGARFSEGKI